ncbi:MAG: type II secretion system protein N [Gammaproteobacteria bacterium]|nr:type II secretion system protein N [Gammaproteobacteria bacterium]
MKGWIKYLGLGVLAYLVFLAVKFPANQAYSLVEPYLPEMKVPLKLYAVKGSVWDGQSGRVEYNKMSFDKVSWEFIPLDLLRGKLSLAVNFRNPDSFANLIVSRSIGGSILLQNVRASMSAQEILSMAKIPAVKLGGDFTLNLSELSLHDQKLEAVNGRLVWSKAESMFPQKLMMGDLLADLSTADNGDIQVKLGDGGGPLELSGGLTVKPDGKYDVTTLMSSREGRNSMLGRSLGFMARYNNEGKAEFKRSGNISEFGFLVK